MRSAILSGLTLFVLVSGTFAANLICYSPQFDDSIDPLAPISIKVAFN